jgi:hypothetical protein
MWKTVFIPEAPKPSRCDEAMSWENACIDQSLASRCTRLSDFSRALLRS